MTERDKLKIKQRELLVKREDVINRAKTLKLEYQSLLTVYQPRINELQEEANQLAPQFRRLFEKSQEAYRNEEKALAKSLSLEGRAIQAQCEALNAEANTMRRELKAMLDKVDSLYREAENCEAQVIDYQEKERLLRTTSIKGFTASGILVDENIEIFLDEFPKIIFKEIERVEFVDQLRGNESNTSLGNTKRDLKTNKAKIEIYRDPFSRSQKEAEIELKETIAHEIGHVVFERFMTDKEHWQWGEWHMNRLESLRQQDSVFENAFISKIAVESRSDDFCECFMFYVIKPTKLEKFDKERYNFIKGVYKTFKRKANEVK